VPLPGTPFGDAVPGPHSCCLRECGEAISRAEPVLAAYAAEHEYGQWWQLTMSAVLRLTLAVRDADTQLLVDDAVLELMRGKGRPGRIPGPWRQR
jgi:hypothetical protein